MIQRSTPPVAVVGSGPGGLAAAMLAAASGLSVRLYEAMPEVGGRTGRETLGDFQWDRGPTFFMMPYVLEEIFVACGRRLAEEVELHRLDPMYRLVFGAGKDGDALTIDTTQDISRMAARLDGIQPGDGAAFERFILENRRKLESMTPILRRPIRGWLDLLSRDIMRCGPVLNPHQSLYRYLAQRFRHPQIRFAMGFQSKYLGMSPHECPSLFSILPFIEYEYGIWHPTGGCHAIMQAMKRICEELGVEIMTDAPVERLTFTGTRCTGVVVRGEQSPHDHVIINADATWALKHLIPAALRGSNTDRAIDARKYSCSTFMLYLGVRDEVELPHHTIYVSGSYEENLADITTRGRLSDDPSCYVCNPSRTDTTLAPRGDSALYVLAPVPNLKSGQLNWTSEAPAFRRVVLEQLANRLGIADLESRIVVERAITPIDWQAMRINHGATFNLAHNLGQMLHRRPQHRMPGVDGVWFVGGGTHPGSGLPVIFLSAQIVSRLLCAELGCEAALDREAVTHN